MHEPESGPVDPLPRHTEAPAAGAVTEGIARDLLAIHRDSYGRAARDAEAYVMDDTVIVILNDLDLLPYEELMISQGRTEAVQDLRHQFQKAIEPTFRAAVERATGRRVTGFASHSQVEDEPRFALEVFKLEPIP